MEQQKKMKRSNRRRFSIKDPAIAREAVSTFLKKTNDRYFNLETFHRLVEDMRSGRIPKAKMTMTEDNLLVLLRNTGEISFHAIYTVGEKRSSLLIGEHPGMSLDRARRIADNVRAIAARGVDPQEGLHKRLISEIEAQGARWKP